MFCAMATGLCPPDTLGSIPGICIGSGCALQCLPWGRLLSAYDLRRALAVTAIAAVVASLVGLGQLLLPEVGAGLPVHGVYDRVRGAALRAARSPCRPCGSGSRGPRRHAF